MCYFPPFLKGGEGGFIEELAMQVPTGDYGVFAINLNPMEES